MLWRIAIIEVHVGKRVSGSLLNAVLWKLLASS